jgi:hypothetical protein
MGVGKRVNGRKRGRSRPVTTFTELVAMATRGVDEVVGKDGTKAVAQTSLYLRRLVAGLKDLRDVSVRIFRAGTGPAVRAFAPGGDTVPKIIRRVAKGVEPYHGMTFRTRLTGGIREAIGYLTPDRAVVVELGGYLFPFPGGASKFRDLGNDFSGELKDAGKKAVGKWKLKRSNPATGKTETYEKAHLWGFIFGDEARDGIMYAPREFNQFWQSKKVEAWVEQLGKQVRALNGNLVLRARATSYSPGEITAAAKGTKAAGEAVRAGQGEYLLKTVTYELMIESPQKPGVLQPFTELVFEIPPPWKPKEKLKLPSVDSDLAKLPSVLF